MGNTIEQLAQRPQDLDEAAVRVAMEAALKEENRPLSQVAPEMGIPYGTVSAWRGGKYQGDTQRVARAVQAWLNSRTARARARATLPAEPGFILTKTASRIWDLLEFSQTTPCIGVVVGGAGVGKTSAFEGYRQQLPNTVWLATMQPYHVRINAALREVAETLELGAPSRIYDLVRVITRRLRGTRGLLIVDEAQHLPPEVLDQLRSLSHAAGIGMVLGGNRQLMANLGADKRSEQLAQLYSRIGMKLTLNRPLKDDIRALLDAWQVDGEAERDTAMAIALRPGAVRVMSTILRVAFALAHVSGAEKPAAQHIESAWRQLSGEVAA